MIYKDKVARLLSALAAKNIPQIVALKIYLPSIGIPTDTTVVQAWIDRARTVLESINLFTRDTQVTSARSTVYKKLCISCKALVDAQSLDDACTVDYERVRAIRLYEFATSPP